ncbi:MAG TPA: hypothetical protein VG889_02240 [Rhizomicrobium sp.]|nr:hypothetical protein [Rhizomicrobium sp.]
MPALAAVLLLVAAGVQLAMPASADLPVAARPKAQQAAQETERAPPAVYRAVMAHPIFAPDRAPPPAEAEDTGNLSGVEVLGTAIEGNKAAAALLRDSDGTFERVKIGGEIEGWKLVAIAPKELTFDRNGERRSLTVDTEKLRAAKGAAGPGAKEQAPISEPDDDSDDSDDSEDE